LANLKGIRKGLGRISISRQNCNLVPVSFGKERGLVKKTLGKETLGFRRLFPLGVKTLF